MIPIGFLGLDSYGISPRSIRVKHVIVIRPQHECVIAGKRQVSVY